MKLRFIPLLSLSLLFLVSCNSEVPSPEEQLGDLDSLERVIKSQQIEIEQISQASDPINTFQLKMLRQKGLENPHETLLNDLQSKREMITYEGVLGGQMQFRNVYLLTGKWLMAEFDDGHIQGYALLEFTVDSPENIEWKVIDAYLE
jgi:hypothetical protein